MVLFNHATREMTAKIVYYGPGLCGKTTNLMVIFDKLAPEQKGKMLSLATKTDRTLFFDLLPLEVGVIGGMKVRLQLYTVPGQVFYNETRKLVLKGADSVVFVADSQPSMVESTRESFNNLMENLEQNQIDPNDTPIVIQFNKRDLPGVLPVDQLQEMLGFEGYPYTEASAIRGDGVMETFKLVSKITAKHLLGRLKGKSEPIERAEKRKAAEARVAAKAAAMAIPEPVAEPEINPFADSVPFPESAPLESGYEKMEEVSLEQLLSEGRERPATISGTIAVPISDIDEVEELGADEMVAIEEPTPVSVAMPVAVMDEPEVVAAAPEPEFEPEPLPSGDGELVAELEAEVAALHERLDLVKKERRAALETILSDLDALAARVRAQLD